jgi:L-rhamnose isomerase / sugar isomerase
VSLNLLASDWIADQNKSALSAHQTDLEHALEQLDRRGIDGRAVIDTLAAFSVAVPSWALGTGGTRFGRFPLGGEPRTIEEKLADCAVINRLTRANRTVSLHIPWDNPDDPQALVEYAKGLELGFDAMNSNTFQDQPGQVQSYKFGSLCHTDKAVRDQAIAHNLDVIALGEKLGSDQITIWLADGSSFPGQMDIRGAFERTESSLVEIYQKMPGDYTMFLEHKPYEPAFYMTVIQDWGSSYLMASRLGGRAQCLVDLGHHLPNSNIEQVVSRLLMADKLGGFHFNDSKYGDDDITTGSIKPYQLFLVFVELAAGQQVGGPFQDKLAFMIDASHNLKDPIEDLLQSTDAITLALAQSLVLNRSALSDAQQNNDVTQAQELLHAAYRLDVRPLVAEARLRNGGALSPIEAYRASNYRRQIIEERGTEGGAAGL